MSESPRLLFVPVSGPYGRGEYARAVTIAKGAAARWPDAEIQFVVSREAPYAASTPFATTLLDSSPTFHSAAVIDLIERWRPDVVIFDNAGRTAQLRAAKRCGARVVYVSARRRQRAKAFRLRWMRVIDQHWIAYPEFIAGPLGFVERLKLAVMGRPAIRYLDVILDSARADESLLARIGFAAGGFVLVVPGGGTGHPGARDAVEQYRATARALAAAGVDTIFVGGADAGAGTADAAMSRLCSLGSLPQPELAELMRAARLIIANGGSTLLQGLACGRPCIAVPVADDQAGRVRSCVSAGAVVAARLDPASMVQAANALLADGKLEGGGQLEALAGRAIALGLRDGVATAVHALSALI